MALYDIIKVIFGLFVWTLSIHLVEENIYAFYLVLGLGFNVYMAHYWVVSARPPQYRQPDQRHPLISDRVFKLYLFHIILAKICFFWYIYLSLDGIGRTLTIWEEGFFTGESAKSRQSRYNISY